jgi:transcriptional regulator with XRE-family HTH domain
MSSQPASSPAGIPEWDTADRMRKALREAGVTGRQMAAYLGVNEATVSTWINGRISPSTQTLRLWALRTGVSYTWLRDGTGARPGPAQQTNPPLSPATEANITNTRWFRAPAQAVAA